MHGKYLGSSTSYKGDNEIVNSLGLTTKVVAIFSIWLILLLFSVFVFLTEVLVVYYRIIARKFMRIIIKVFVLLAEVFLCCYRIVVCKFIRIVVKIWLKVAKLKTNLRNMKHVQRNN